MELETNSSTIALDYSNKKLRKFPERILVSKNLRMLCLDGNELTILPDIMFITLTRLTWLDVRDNKLTVLSPKIGKCRYLETLLIQGNHICRLPMELGLVENLKTLLISGNPITYPSSQILELGICGIIQFLKGEYDTIGKGEKTVKRIRKSKIVEHSIGSSKNSKRIIKKRKISTKKVVKSEASEFVASNNLTINRQGSNNSTSTADDSYNERTVLQNKDRGDSIIPASRTKSLKTVKPIKKVVKKPTTSKINLLPKRNSDRYLARTNLKRSALRAKERSLKDLWTNRLRVLLERQAAIIQRRQTIEALKNWRTQVEKFHTLSNDEKLDPPFDLDSDFLKMPTRSEYQTQLATNSLISKKSTFNIKNKNTSDFSSKIDGIIASIKALDRLNHNSMLTPTQEQKLLETEMKKLNEIQKALSSLKFENEQELMV